MICGVDGEEDRSSKEEKIRRKRTKSSIVQELRNEYLDLPEEVNVSHMTCHAHVHLSSVSCLPPSPLSTGCGEWPQESQGS